MDLSNAICLNRSARWVAVALGLTFAALGTMEGQQRARVDRGQRISFTADPADTLFPGGAALKTGNEYERMLARAEQYIAENRADLAATLWQKVLDEATDTLTAEEIVRPVGPASTPLVIYRPVRERVEQQMLRSPAAALSAYRTSADAEARAILASATAEQQHYALNEVARRFFLSANGAQAALTLTGLALDRQDFVAAGQILSRLQNHPDFSLLKKDVFSRQAVVAAHLGDQAQADQSLAQFADLDRSVSHQQSVELIATEVRAAPQRRTNDRASAIGWPMLFGNSARSGQMPEIPTAALSGPLTEIWSHELTIPTDDQPASPIAIGPGGDPTTISAQAKTNLRDELRRQWRNGGWRPTGRLLFDKGRIFVKSADRLECFDTAAVPTQLVWQSAWQNIFELDRLSRELTRLVGVPGRPTLQSPVLPNTRQAIWMFGDRVHQSMAIDDGVIYSLEGRRTTAVKQPANPREILFGMTARRARSNWLTAYQTSGGKAIWTRSAAEDEKPAAGDTGFLAAPVVCGRLLFAPITDGGTIWLLSLDRATGKTVRKTFLCDEPLGSASPWAEIVMAAEGSELYLTCGCGVVFAINAADGGIRWALRYSRTAPGTAANPVSSGDAPESMAMPPAAQGWDDDVVILHESRLLIMASDSNQLVALDRRSGQRLWESPRISPLGSAASYCLGTTTDALFVAGKNVIRKYDLASGRLVAERPIDDSLGRGCLTNTAALVPVTDKILKFDLSLAAPAQIDVALASGEPVGSLFSNGRQICIVGAGRVYSLTTVENRLQLLEPRIATEDIGARFERAQLYGMLRRFTAMEDDLRAAFEALATKTSLSEATDRVVQALDESQMAGEQPLVTLKVLASLNPVAATQTQLSPEALQSKRDVVANALSAIRQHRPTGSVSTLLKAAQLFDGDYLQTAAAQALDSAATSSDALLLLRALPSGSVAVRLISIRTAARLAPREATKPLVTLLSDPDDRVRLAAARALASIGERSGVLEALVELLKSPRVDVRSRAHHTLQALTGQQIPFAAESSEADRAASVRSWQQWLQSSSPGAALNLPLQDRVTPLGRLLIASPNLLVELDAERKERWRTPLSGAAWGCEGLGNGHRLVAINSHSMVIEYDDAGREVWRKDRLPAPPTTVQRLISGATLIACGNARQIAEVAPDGSTTTINVPGLPVSAQRLDNGNTLVALQDLQRVAEVNSSGRTLWEVETTGPPAHAVRLENGNTLVTLPQARKVVEYDTTDKKIVWMSAVPLINASAAQRLPSGHTLVAEHTGVVEIDTSGTQIVWRYRQPQATGVSNF
jgi:outer membrane protein assembly factor BamB